MIPLYKKFQLSEKSTENYTAKNNKKKIMYLQRKTKEHEVALEILMFSLQEIHGNHLRTSRKANSSLEIKTCAIHHNCTANPEKSSVQTTCTSNAHSCTTPSSNTST